MTTQTEVMGYFQQSSLFSRCKLPFRLIPQLVLSFFCFSFSVGICHSQDVSDRHSCTIRGQVTDKQNNPLAGYIVSTVTPKDNITYASKTNSGGEFSLTHLPIGTWNVEVRHLSERLAQREITVVDETIADFLIEGTSAISGFLLDPDNKLPLQITDDLKFARIPQDDERIEQIYKGKVTDGYFEVGNLLPGVYRIIDAIDDYVFAMSDLPLIMVYPHQRVNGIDVYLKKGASVDGRLIDAESGQPISGAIVSVASEKSDSLYSDGTETHEAETDKNGEFRLTTPNESDLYYAFTVIASHSRYQTHRWRWEIPPNKDKYTLGELSLKPFLTMQGIVSAPNVNQTVDGLTVQIMMRNEPADFFRAAAQPEHTVITDVAGNFLFTELHPIEYSLTISYDDVIIAYLETVNPQAKDPLLIHLPKLKTLYGKVVDTQQQPISDAQLYAARSSENPNGHETLLATTQTDTKGAFSMQILKTDPKYLSVGVSKKGYLSRVYPTVEIVKDPMTISLETGYAIKGRVILSKYVPTDSFYDVKVFVANTEMIPSLNPISLNRPLMSKRFSLTDQTFVLDGLFEEKYTLYITGESFGATGIEVNATAHGDAALIIADMSTVVLKGQVLWADTGEPVRNALILRSWYPWDLNKYDMSLTLDRFETETDAEGKFLFSNLTQGRYHLHIRAVETVWKNEIGQYHRVYTQKQIDIPICSENTHLIYMGKADGTSFTE